MKNATPTTNDSWLYGWESIDWHNQRLDRTRKQLEDGEIRQLDWPWSSWNRRIRPAAPGQLSILTAADGQGKSTYLESIAEHWTQQGAHVCLAHLEDDHGYKLNRRLARHSKIPLGTIEDGIPDQLDRGRRDSANSQMASWAERLHYYHAPGQTMRQICRELESRHKQGLCDAVVLDYLDKCVADRRQVRLYGDNIWERQADDMETLKSFAERLGLPVFTATQGNKSMQRQGTITRSSIQGSGQKSHKSQLVLILTRELLESDQHTNGGDLIGKKGDYSPIVNVRIDKQNRGMTGEFQQYLRGECFLVVDLEATT